MCLTNQSYQDKKPLSQKLIVRNSRFNEFCTAKWCVITDVYGMGFYILTKTRHAIIILRGTRFTELSLVLPTLNNFLVHSSSPYASVFMSSTEFSLLLAVPIMINPQSKFVRFRKQYQLNSLHNVLALRVRD